MDRALAQWLPRPPLHKQLGGECKGRRGPARGIKARSLLGRREVSRGDSEPKPAMPLRLVDPDLNQTCGSAFINRLLDLSPGTREMSNIDQTPCLRRGIKVLSDAFLLAGR